MDQTCIRCGSIPSQYGDSLILNGLCHSCFSRYGSFVSMPLTSPLVMPTETVPIPSIPRSTGAITRRLPSLTRPAPPKHFCVACEREMSYSDRINYRMCSECYLETCVPCSNCAGLEKRRFLNAHWNLCSVCSGDRQIQKLKAKNTRLKERIKTLKEENLQLRLSPDPGDIYLELLKNFKDRLESMPTHTTI